MKIFVAILLSLLLMSCTNNDSLKGSIDRSSKPIATTVYFYQSIDEVQKKFRELHNLSSSEKVSIQGFAQWPEFRDNNGQPIEDDSKPLTCEIHIVKPQKVDDEATTTLGHEMLHCIIGTYHSGNHN